MIKFSLAALSATTIFAVSFSAQAQTPQSKTATPEKAIQKSSDTFENPVVATVGSKKIYWGQVIERMNRENPNLLQSNVAQVIGAKVATDLFGPKKQPQAVVTKNEALNLLRQNPTQDVQRVTGTLIQLEVTEEEAAKQGIKGDRADVVNYLNKLMKTLRQNGSIPPEQTDAQFLATRGLNTDKAVYLLRLQYLANELTQKQIEKDLGHPLGDADFVQARHILVKIEVSAADAKPEETKKAEDAALAKIKGLAADIKSKKITFEEAAKQSDDPGSKERGGDLGVFTHGRMVPEFDKAAFSLKPGELSEPIRTQYGYHILEVTKAGKDLPAAEKTQQIEGYRAQKLNEFMPALMAKYKTENKLQKASPMGGMPMAPGGGRPMPRPIPTPPNGGQPTPSAPQ